MKKYSTSSPYFDTDIANNILSYFQIRTIPAEPDDYLYTIEPQYTYRPDLLAYDLYKNSKLWWVLTQRNLDVIQDPIFDFVAGVQIYIPKGDSLVKSLRL